MNKNAPGCFASASVFSVDSAVCNACPVFADCSNESLVALQRIQSSINVSDLLAKHERAKQKTQIGKMASLPKPPSVPSVSSSTMGKVERKTKVEKVKFSINAENVEVIQNITNSKAQKAATVLCKSNLLQKAQKELPTGRNAFATEGPSYLRVTCDLLIAGGFTKASLTEALVSRLGWSKGAASSHTSIACGLLTAFGLMQETSGKFVISPSVT
jgi:hypothetical protein